VGRGKVAKRQRPTRAVAQIRVGGGRNPEHPRMKRGKNRGSLCSEKRYYVGQAEERRKGGRRAEPLIIGKKGRGGCPKEGKNYHHRGKEGASIPRCHEKSCQFPQRSRGNRRIRRGKKEKRECRKSEKKKRVRYLDGGASRRDER